MLINPLLNYRAIDRASTAALAQQEAEFFDAVLASDGFDGEIDVLVDNPDDPGGPQILLVVPLLREKPKVRTQGGEDGTPTVGQPKRASIVYSAPRSILQYIEIMGGRTLKIDGLRLTISYAEPIKMANVVYRVDLHCDPEEGMFVAGSMGGIL